MAKISLDRFVDADMAREQWIFNHVFYEVISNDNGDQITAFNVRRSSFVNGKSSRLRRRRHFWIWSDEVWTRIGQAHFTNHVISSLHALDNSKRNEAKKRPTNLKMRSSFREYFFSANEQKKFSFKQRIVFRRNGDCYSVIWNVPNRNEQRRRRRRKRRENDQRMK